MAREFEKKGQMRSARSLLLDLLGDIALKPKPEESRTLSTINQPILAIETSYSGYKFRSRTEARWAVFLDTLKLKWEYEREGYQLPGIGQYLPDFIVTHNSEPLFILEVKHANLTGAERVLAIEKVRGLVCCGVAKYGMVALGPPNSETLIISVLKTEVDSRAESMRANFGCLGQENLEVAINRAKSARFEFGESGAG